MLSFITSFSFAVDECNRDAATLKEAISGPMVTFA
jgi:hypothetical protein